MPKWTLTDSLCSRQMAAFVYRLVFSGASFTRKSLARKTMFDVNDWKIHYPVKHPILLVENQTANPIIRFWTKCHIKTRTIL